MSAYCSFKYSVGLPEVILAGVGENQPEKYIGNNGKVITSHALSFYF